jgi:hypothetical protein
MAYLSITDDDPVDAGEDGDNYNRSSLWFNTY